MRGKKHGYNHVLVINFYTLDSVPVSVSWAYSNGTQKPWGMEEDRSRRTELLLVW
jgi:hypothetical protein